MLKIILSFTFLVLNFTLAWSFQSPLHWQDKISPRLQEKVDEGQSTLDFLLVLHQKADLSAASEIRGKFAKATFVFNQLQQTAQNTQAPLLDILSATEATYQFFYVVNAIRVKGDINLLQSLAAHPNVEKVLENGVYQLNEPMVESVAPQRDPQTIEWSIQMINADQVWEMGYTGQGAVVGGQDTGYEWDHIALKEKYRGYVDESTVDHNYSWHDAIHEINPLNGDTTSSGANNPCGLDTNAPCADRSHGTHTMGTMVGSEGDNEIGVAPNAKWIGCRNMERGWGQPSTYIECFEWLMAPTDLSNENPNPALAPHAFANSWGCPPIEGCDTSNFNIMETVVDNVKASGVVVVVSAGNSGSDCSSVDDPAAIFENSFTVGSTNPNDTISGFSSRGPVLVDGSFRMKPDISAPGRQVRSSVLNDEYAAFSGTSMAGPHVVGVIALMISANPDLAGEVDLIETLIKNSAVAKTTDQDCGTTAGTAVPNNTYGHGRIDALAAVQASLALVTDTEDLVSNDVVEVYPNPFSGQLHFAFKEITGYTTLRLTNNAGQVIHRTKWDLNPRETKTVGLPDLPHGIYFYQLVNAGKTYQGKLVK